jgi:lambda family phage minor tail protein L
MAGEGKNKVATSLLDLQPTAVLELFKVFPDRINKPNDFLGFHGGTDFDKSIIWQGIQYLPLAMETEGFDILGDGKLPRPIIRVANTNNIITNILQNHKDLINAKVIRKRVSVKFLDDENFDGGNPFGRADPTAELTEEKWIMGRKVQESKVFVEFELNSPLDLENFSVNSRGVVAKFCYWQYRGEGCQYKGIPIERDDGSPFVDPAGSGVVPNMSSNNAPIFSLDDPSYEWNASHTYQRGDIVFINSPSIRVSTNTAEYGQPLKTVYVCTSGNSAQSPQGNPTYWQKDGCTKKFPACQKRFNNFNLVGFQGEGPVTNSFNAVKISGIGFNPDPADEETFDGYSSPQHTGFFQATGGQITGYLTGAFTIVGWANLNMNTAYGASVLSTSSRSDGVWPTCRHINIGADVLASAADPDNPAWPGTEINAYHMGYLMSPTSNDPADNTYRNQSLAYLQEIGSSQRDWKQYVTRHSTGIESFLNGEGIDRDTHLEIFARPSEVQTTLSPTWLDGWTQNANEDPIEKGLGDFASIAERNADPAVFTRDDGSADPKNNGLPEYFRLGASNHYYGINGYINGDLNIFMEKPSINGALGPWALWNRALSDEELDFLFKSPTSITSQDEGKQYFDHVPRPYEECTGIWSTLTGGTGDGTPDGTAPMLYGQNSLVAWWDGTTGDSSIANGLVDIHTGEYHLSGSGEFEAITESYEDTELTLIDNPTSPYPRFGGYPGTDGFSYGRDSL